MSDTRDDDHDQARERRSPLRDATWPEAARILAALAVVSVGAALFAMAFRAGIQLAYGSLFGAHDVLEVFVRLPLAAKIALPAAGGLLAGILALVTKRSTGGAGVGDVMEAV